MTTFFLDLEGGNDSNDGTTFANRWKTFTSGATAARIAPGDTIKVMASPDETLVGDATWTNASKTVTLAGAVTAAISDCSSAWTASTNVTANTTGTRKEGTLGATIAVAGAFTTGLAAYFATGTIDLSAYQQVSFWIQVNSTPAAGSLSLRLCTDVAGVTSVHTIAVPAIAASGYWQAFTVDTGGALNSSIKSVALYVDTDLGAGSVTVLLDNIIAVKSVASADALSLTSLIGKVWNRQWVASTTYATNDIRRPTGANRNGYRYKITAGGGSTSGSSEPTWPTLIGATVVDNGVTWTCEGLEDTWYAIQSINGTTVLIDNDPSALANAGRGYAGTTETVATYKRQPIALNMAAAFNSTTTANVVQDSGTAASPITFSGGWDRTAMTAQSGETWCSGQNGWGAAISASSKNFLTVRNIHGVRYSVALNFSSGLGLRIENCSNNHSAAMAFTSCQGTVIGLAACNNVGTSYSGASAVMRGAAWTVNNQINSFGTAVNVGIYPFELTDVVFKNNDSSNFIGQGGTAVHQMTLRNLVTANNTGAPISPGSGGVTLINASIAEGTPITVPTTSADGYVFSHRHNATVDNHLITTDGGTIISATDQRHTASGIAWKFRPTSTARASNYPLRLSVAKIACAASVAVNVQIWVRRDSTNITGRLHLVGGQLAGVADTLNTADAPSVNTWTQSATLTFTPSEAGVVEVFYECWDGVGTSNNLWIDDLTVS